MFHRRKSLEIPSLEYFSELENADFCDSSLETDDKIQHSDLVVISSDALHMKKESHMKKI